MWRFNTKEKTSIEIDWMEYKENNHHRRRRRSDLRIHYS